MKPITRGWLNRAREDLEVVERIIDATHLTNIVAFHCQQAIEKTFKAVIEENSEEVPRIHNLVRLYNLIKNRLAVEINELVLKEISDVYIEARYPGELGLLPYGISTIEDVKRFYNVAQMVYSNTQEQLSQLEDDIEGSQLIH
jgi:HEPN domain-containing protein